MKKNELKSILNEIEKYNKIIKESYVFSEEDEELLPQDDAPMGDNYDLGGDEEPSFVDGGDIQEADDIVNDIRDKALSGVAKFSREVDSEEYNIFKNIWMACDKFYSSKNKEENSEEK